jgi:hypothetical protein
MKKLTSKLALHAAFVALFAAGAIMLPAVNVFDPAGIAGKAFAKDGDSGDSDSDGDGGNSGSGGDGRDSDSDSDGGDSGSDSNDGDSDSDSDGGNSGSGSDSRDSDSDTDSNDDGNSGSDSSNSGRGSDDSNDDGDDDSRDDDGDDDRSGRESRDRPEVPVSLTPEQIQAVLSGQSRLVDNLGRTLELEIEVEHGVTTYSAKPHGGDARRNPGPISDVSVVAATRAPVNNSTNDDGTPDQGPGDR